MAKGRDTVEGGSSTLLGVLVESSNNQWRVLLLGRRSRLHGVMTVLTVANDNAINNGSSDLFAVGVFLLIILNSDDNLVNRVGGHLLLAAAGADAVDKGNESADHSTDHTDEHEHAADVLAVALLVLVVLVEVSLLAVSRGSGRRARVVAAGVLVVVVAVVVVLGAMIVVVLLLLAVAPGARVGARTALAVVVGAREGEHRRQRSVGDLAPVAVVVAAVITRGAAMISTVTTTSAAVVSGGGIGGGGRVLLGRGVANEEQGTTDGDGDGSGGELHSCELV